MSNLNYRTDIDGLRAIAVLAVLVFHLNDSWLHGGFVGVDIFFVISGYLITKIIVTEIEQNKFSFTYFYQRRIYRIFPALFAMLLTSAVVAYLSFPRGLYRSFFVDFKFSVAQMSNFHFAREIDYMAIGIETSPLLHTWSLAVEEQFYIVWPLFIFAVLTVACKKRLKILMLLIAVLSLGINLYFLNMNDFNNAFYMFYARAYELAIGSVVALTLLPNIRNKWQINLVSYIGAGMVIYSVTIITRQSIFPGFNALIPSIGTALLIYAGTQNKGAVYKILSNRLLVSIGLISYSLYLWHWPIISYYKYLTQRELNIIEAIVIAILSFLLAYFSYKYIEKPFRNQKNTISYIKLFGGSFAFIVVLMVLSHQFKIREDSLPLRDNRDDKFLQTNFKEINKYHSGCTFEDGHSLKIKKNCIVWGNENHDKLDVLLIGDSHAIHYYPTVAAWTKKNKLNAYMVSHSSCPVFVASDYKVYSKDKNYNCQFVVPLVKDIIKKYKIKKIIYAHTQNSFFNGKKNIDFDLSSNTADAYFKLWENEIKFYYKQGIEFAFLSQVPQYNIDFKKCYQKYNNTFLGKFLSGSWQECAQNYQTIKPVGKRSFDQKLSDLALKNGHFSIFIPDAKKLTPMNKDGILHYIDTNHLNRFGSMAITSDVGRFLDHSFK